METYQSLSSALRKKPGRALAGFGVAAWVMETGPKCKSWIEWKMLQRQYKQNEFKPFLDLHDALKKWLTNEKGVAKLKRYKEVIANAIEVCTVVQHNARLTYKTRAKWFANQAVEAEQRARCVKYSLELLMSIRDAGLKEFGEDKSVEFLNEHIPELGNLSRQTEANMGMFKSSYDARFETENSEKYEEVTKMKEIYKQIDAAMKKLIERLNPEKTPAAAAPAAPSGAV